VAGLAFDPLPIAPSTLPLADPATRAKIHKTATEFEASFLQVMLGQMFDGVDAGAFGGGEGEDAFKSFMTDAFAKSMANAGGVGLSKDLTREMLKMQGLS
jgi:Rod binding domain-containing protein